MLSVLIPGYEAIYGKPSVTYDELLKNIPSSIVISTLITLNAQSHGIGDPYPFQHDTLSRVFRLLPPAEVQVIVDGLKRFNASRQGLYKGFVFGKRYLLYMMTRELNRNNTNGPLASADNLLNILKAYFLVCDEINQSNERIIRPLLSLQHEPGFTYRLLWSVLNDQFIYNETGNPAFEIFKVTCFIRYALDHWRQQLKEFLDVRNMDSPGNLLDTMQRVAMATEFYNPDHPFPKLFAMLPESSPQHGFFEKMCVNLQPAITRFELPHLKKFPLFRDIEGKYRVIDHDFYHKKIYKGVLFDFLEETSLKDRFPKIPDYLTTVAKEMMEALCFRSVFKCLPKSAHDLIHFDDETPSVPDCYYRTGKDVYLIEFKENLFPDKPKGDSGYEKIKSFIDERFAYHQDGKRKGVYQVLHQIRMLQDKQFDYDTRFVNELSNKNVMVFPIICVNEFHVSIPGVNQYLNDLFLGEANSFARKNIRIRPLTIISLEVFFDLYFRGYSIDHIGRLIERYWRIIHNRKVKKELDPILLHYRSMESFDEVYFSVIISELNPVTDYAKKLERLVNTVGLTEDIINAPVMV